ncbi:DNA modification methylase [Afipia massiliensis]|uniref:Methyltransferase n=1 Tax=Afipia massiliensis TaxID=211460 RepID=A0A840N308_9BRAD|nr:DNA modification methylase [Afipia massiliensis]MBB5052917.1 DNA modification methylase [Afipia massiliensis]
MTHKNSLEIVYLKATAIKPSPHAARQHSSAQRRKLKAILRQFGQVVPLPLDAATGTLIDGHAVFDALVELGHDEIAVVQLENRSEPEVRALRLALNRVAQDAVWDNAKLRGEFEYLISVGFDLDLGGFEAVEIDMALSIDTPAANTVEEEALDDLAPMAGPSAAKPGDVFRLGDHLIGCGDARDTAFIRDLVGTNTVACVFSDPPYNVPIDGFVSGLGKTRHREFAMGTGEMSRDQFVAFLSTTVAAIKPVLADGAILFLCMDWRHGSELCEAAAQNHLEQKNLCVWTKSNAGMGSFYRSQHELIYVFKHGEGPHQNNFGLGASGRSRSNVWQYRGVNAFGKDRMDLLGIHPTVKPVAMIADALRDVTRRGDLVLDVFLGSGSTLIAAEETGRVCIGVELDPVYVDAAIRRWQKRTGKNAVHAATGETFDAIAERVVSPVTTMDVAVAELPAGAAATGALVAADLPIASTNVTEASVTEAGDV